MEAQWRETVTSTVSLGKITYFTLSRHRLLDRARRGRELETIEGILGLNAQGALNYGLSLWARVEGLDRKFINAAILDRRLIRSWFMRNTVHILPVSLAHLARAALRDSLVAEWNQWTVKTGSKESPSSWERHYGGVLEALREGPIAMSEILDRVGGGPDDKRVLHRVVREMSLKGLVCNAASRGPWYHDAEHTYADASQWAPPASYVEPNEARRVLLLRYMRSYGPATIQDYAYWTGMKVSDARATLEEVKPALSEVRAERHKGRLYALKEDLPELEATEEKPSLRLLPKFDALIMSHRDKTRLMDEETRRRVFLPTAEAAATIFVDGRVEGVWSIKRLGSAWNLELQLFRRLDGEAEETLQAELDAMRAFTGFDIEASIVRLDSATSSG
jgi:uncharacterized protein YcaQ